MVRSLRRPESYDPRPHNRQQDLALQKAEYDADTARINQRIREMNRNARVQYRQQMAAQRVAQKKKPKQRGGLIDRVAHGLRRMFA